MSSNTTESSSKIPLARYLPSKLAIIGVGLAIVWFVTSLGGGSLLEIGAVAPSWKLREPNSNKRYLSLEQLKGKVVVVDFWSLGCPPCMKMVAELNTVAKDFENRQVAVVGISAWGESKIDVFRLKQKRNLSYHLLVGSSEVVTAYKVDALPTLYILDKEGKIAHRHQGFMSREALKEAVLSVLGE